MLKNLWLRIRQSRIGQGFGALGAQFRQITSRQWGVTVSSAVIMLVALTVFWNHFILPEHLPDSYGNNATEIAQSESQETAQKTLMQASAGTSSSQADSRENLKGNGNNSNNHNQGNQRNQRGTVDTEGNSTPTGAEEVASTQTKTKTASNDPLSSLPVNPDLSLAKNPVAGELIKEFGFVFFPTLKDYRFHGAIDVAAAKGTSVKSILDGVVESVYSSAEAGKSVIVNHGGGLKSVYRHLGEVSVEKDTSVEAGAKLGSLGQPGSLERVEGAHLHFELIRDGEHIDPLEYFSY